MLKLATVAALLGAATLAAPSSAASSVGATSVVVRSAVGGPIQVPELQAFETGTGANIALLGSATAASVAYNGPAVPGLAIDGITIGDYPNLYHSDGSGPGEFLMVAFAAPASLASLTIFGRNGCCKDRDSYTIEIFRGADSIYSGTLDARSGFGTISFVPEPATWGLMVAGFGLTGFALRRKSVTTPA